MDDDGAAAAAAQRWRRGGGCRTGTRAVSFLRTLRGKGDVSQSAIGVTFLNPHLRERDAYLEKPFRMTRYHTAEQQRWT